MTLMNLRGPLIIYGLSKNFAMGIPSNISLQIPMIHSRTSMTSMTVSDPILIHPIILSIPLESTVITLMDWSVLLNFTRVYPYPSQVPSTFPKGAADFRVKCIASATLLDLTAV